MSTHPPSTTDARPYAPPSAAPRRGDSIDQWLAMFTRFLNLSTEQKRSIRDELDSHIRERVRDLMLGAGGLNEDEGIRRAIDELGEAAELAAHFNAVHKPQRRTLMSIATVGVAASAAVISLFALNQTPQPTKAVEGVPVLKDIPLVGSLFTPGSGAQLDRPIKLDGKIDAPSVRRLAEMLADAAGKRLSLNPGEYDVNKLLPAVELVDTDARGLMQIINDRAQLIGPSRFDYRVRGDVLEVAQERTFDKAETKLVAYDLTPVYAANANGDDLQETIATFVEAEGWRNNGGETAHMKIVGNRMFVQAPPRYHTGVAWILEQFGAPSARRKATADGQTRLAAMLERHNEMAALESAAARAPRAMRTGSDRQRAETLLREIAWQKARLGDQLTAEENLLLDDRAVKSPETAAAVAQARAELEALRAELDAVRAATVAPAPAAANPGSPAPAPAAPAAEGQIRPAPAPAPAPEPK